MHVPPSSGRFPILAYHGVTDAPSEGIENFSGKHVSAEEFRGHMDFISDRMHPVTLRQMARALATGDPLPARAIAVTFDDSYRNVHDVALPIMREYGVPATFFVTSGFVDTGHMFWTDALEFAINTSTVDEVALSLAGSVRTWDLRSKEAKIRAVVEVKAYLKTVARSERDHILSELTELTCSREDHGSVPNYRNLTALQVKSLSSPPHYEVGGHSVNHEILAYLDDDELNVEIKTCVGTLGEMTGLAVDLFSYPEGQIGHFDDRCIAVLRRAGVIASPTAIYGFNEPGADPFYLRRVMAGFMGTPFPYECASTDTSDTPFLKRGHPL